MVWEIYSGETGTFLFPAAVEKKAVLLYENKVAEDNKHVGCYPKQENGEISG